MKKSLKMKIIISVLTILFIVILAIVYISQFHVLTMNNTFANLSEIGSQNVDKLNLQIKSNMNTIQNMADVIEKEKVVKAQDIFDKFESTLKNYGFSSVGMMDLEGNGIDSKGNQVHFTEMAQHKEELLQGVRVNLDMLGIENGSNAMIYTCPLHRETGETEILYVVIDPILYRDVLSKPIFNGKGFSIIVNKQGNILMNNEALKDIDIVNVFEAMDKQYIPSNKLIHTMQENIAKGENGVAFFKYQNYHYYLSYRKLEVNDWYVISMIPDYVVANQISQFIVITIIISCIGILGFTSLLIYILVMGIRRSRALYHIAYTDEVTEIGNKNYFVKQGNEFLAEQENRESLYVLYLDIDKFKVINKKYGYEFGNKVLYHMGKVIQNKFEKQNAIYARLANDGFGIVAQIHIPIDKFLKRFSHKLSQTIIDNVRLNLPISIGVYQVEVEDDTISPILDKAIIAHTKIKGDFITTYQIYDEKLEHNLVREQEIESRMEEALENEEFEVYYQPKVELKNENVAGAEALVRWNDPLNGIVSPGVFIPIFEKNRFIVKLDLYIFERLCQDIKSWKERNIPLHTISVNVSKEHCMDEDFILEYVKITNQYEIDPSMIEIEITESASWDNENGLIEIMKKIKEAGFKLSMDDFGTGYSSLHLLQRMPIDVLKLDSSFIRESDTAGKSQMIVADVIAMAKHIQIKTVAEGIEDEAEVSFLKEVGCDMIQGYYYAKPLNLKQFEAYVLQDESKRKK